MSSSANDLYRSPCWTEACFSRHYNSFYHFSLKISGKTQRIPKIFGIVQRFKELPRLLRVHWRSCSFVHMFPTRIQLPSTKIFEFLWLRPCTVVWQYFWGFQWPPRHHNRSCIAFYCLDQKSWHFSGISRFGQPVGYHAQFASAGTAYRNDLLV
jgi:hypothetical protein